MKKKFINGLLMVALFVGFTSSMVSCKDYDDEKITNLEGVLADNVAALKKALADQKTDLETQINNVNLLIQNCQQTCQAFRLEITQKLKDYYTKKETDSLDNILQQEINVLQQDIIDRTSKAAVAKTVAELLNEGNNVMTTALDAYITNYNNINGIINEDSIRKILQIEVIKLNKAIDEARALAQSGLDLAKADSVRIDGLETTVNGLTTSVQKLREDLDVVTTTANNAWAKAQANETLITNLRTDLNALDKEVDDLTTIVNNNYKELKDLIDEKQKKIDALDEKVESYWTQAKEIHEALDKKITDLDADLTEFKGQVAVFAQQVVEAFNSLLAYVLEIADYLDKSITSIEINGTNNPMYGELALPFSVRSNMLIVFHGTLDDAGLKFPTANSAYAALPEIWEENNFTPDDLKMLFLGTDKPANPRYLEGYAEYKGDIVATQYKEDGETKVKDGNAGTIYLTVNPTVRDFTGTEFTLINSLNEEVPAVLSPLAKSNHKLTFGFTRAGVEDGEDGELQSPNGFYETKVTVDADNISKIGMRFKLDDIKDVVKDIKNYQDGISITKIANAVYNTMTDVLDANAVKASWQAADTTYSTVSQYDLGVTSIRPLSFAFAKDYEVEGFPFMNRIEDFLDNILNIVFEGLPELKFLDRFSIDHLEFNEMTDSLETTIRLYLGNVFIESIGPKWAIFEFPNFEITGVHGEHVVIPNTNPKVEVFIDGNNSYIDVKLSMKEFIEYMGDYDTEDYNNIKKQFNDFLDDVNEFLVEVTGFRFSTIQNNVEAALTKFIDKINARFARFLNPNKYMQPILVAKTVDGLARLTTSKLYPALANGTSVTLIPTTYNAETITPAFKKFVAVTNVFKGADSAQGGNTTCQNVLKAANAAEGLNKVIDGGYSEINFVGQSGYTYEIIYSAADYSGKVVTKKFYLAIN